MLFRIGPWRLRELLPHGEPARWQLRHFGAGARAAKGTSRKPASAAPAATPGARGDRVQPARSAPFGKLRLHKPLQERLFRMGVRAPTEIQSEAFRPAIEGRDLCAISRAGTGKTLAYLLPLLERARVRGWPRHEPIIVLVPTRDLAEQTFVTVNRLRDTATKAVLVYGGVKPHAAESQVQMLRHGSHVIVGTPGRMRELAEAGHVSSGQAHALVVDEADVMLSSSSLAPDVLWFMKQVGSCPDAQRLCFAGTCPNWMRGRLDALLSQPIYLDQLGVQAAVPSGVKHVACEVSGKGSKRARVVAWFLEQHLVSPRAGAEARALVFAPTRAEVVLLSQHAMLRHRVIALHAMMTQQERAAALALFKSSAGHALVTTDLAVRGLEIPSVSLVVHVAAPPTLEVYAHRLGQAVSGSVLSSQHSQACQGFQSVLMCSSSHSEQLRDLKRALREPIEQLAPPNEDELRRAAVTYIGRELREAAMQYDAEAFVEDAQHQLDIHGARLVAAALVKLEHRQRGEEWLSPLSGQRRYTPLLFSDPFLDKLKSRQAVVTAISRAIRRDPAGGRSSSSKRGQTEENAHVGRVALTSKGYIADVLFAHVPQVLADPALRDRGITVTPIAQLPALLEEVRGSQPASVLGESKRQERERRRTRRNRRGAPSPSDRESRRLDFLFPAGRRSPFGDFVPSGQKDADPSAHAS